MNWTRFVPSSALRKKHVVTGFAVHASTGIFGPTKFTKKGRRQNGTDIQCCCPVARSSRVWIVRVSGAVLRHHIPTCQKQGPICY